MDTNVPKMEAGAATLEASTASLEAPTVSPPRKRPTPPGARNPYRFGFRKERYVTTPDGRRVLEQTPLTLDDLVYPQEGDHVTQGLPHFSFLHPESDAVRRHLEKRPHTVVTSDVVLVLRHDGKNSAPDVAVVEGRFDPKKVKGAIHLKKVDARLVFVLEAVSSSDKEVEDKDLKTNKARYAKEGVVDYLTVYPIGGRQVKKLVGWHLEDGDYVEIEPDAQGRVYSEMAGLFFHVDDDSKELVMTDAVTGERLLISDEEETRRRAAEAALDASEAALDASEAALDASEAARRQEAAAKRREAEARRQAVARAEQEAAAQRQAVARAEQEAAAKRREAEARRQLEEQAEKGLRRKVEDLCGLLGIEWSAERGTAVTGMDLAQLETLWADLMSRKRWPR